MEAGKKRLAGDIVRQVSRILAISARDRPPVAISHCRNDQERKAPDGTL